MNCHQQYLDNTAEKSLYVINPKTTEIILKKIIKKTYKNSCTYRKISIKKTHIKRQNKQKMKNRIIRNK
jgi:hypothetical protein